MRYFPNLSEKTIKEVNDLALNYDDKSDYFTEIVPNENKTLIIYGYEDRNHEKNNGEVIYKVDLNINYEDKKIIASINNDLYGSYYSVDFSYDTMIDPLEDPKELVIFAINYYRLKCKK